MLLSGIVSIICRNFSIVRQTLDGSYRYGDQLFAHELLIEVKYIGNIFIAALENANTGTI